MEYTTAATSQGTGEVRRQRSEVARTQHGLATTGRTYESDEELIAGLQRHEPKAAEALYDLFSRQAFGLAYHMLGDGGAAEDVVQESFLSVWREASRIDPRRGKLQSLLLTMVRNKAIDFLRSSRNGGDDLRLEPEWIEASEGDFTERVDAAVDGAVVRSALDALPANQRQAVEFAYYGGLTHAEIAETLGVPLGTVKSRLRMALERLRTVLTKDPAMATAAGAN